MSGVTDLAKINPVADSQPIGAVGRLGRGLFCDHDVKMVFTGI